MASSRLAYTEYPNMQHMIWPLPRKGQCFTTTGSSDANCPSIIMDKLNYHNSLHDYSAIILVY